MRQQDPKQRWARIARRHARARRFIKIAMSLAGCVSIASGALAVVDAAHRAAFAGLTLVALVAFVAALAALKGARDFEREFGERFR